MSATIATEHLSQHFDLNSEGRPGFTALGASGPRSDKTALNMTRYLDVHFATEEGRMSRLRWIAASVVAAFAAASVAAAADDTVLLKQAQQVFKMLPKDMGTPDNPLTMARVELGRMLFFDPRFTIDANMSCATCHRPDSTERTDWQRRWAYKALIRAMRRQS